MAFATNSSTFGIKPTVNTGAFGAQPAQPFSSNPSTFTNFGVSSTQPQPSLFGGLGQNQNQNQSQGQNQNQPVPGGFGQQAPMQQQSQQPSGGLFGGSSWGSGSTNTANTTQGTFGSWGLSGNQQQNQSQLQNQQQQQQQQQQQPTPFGTGSVPFGNAGTQTQIQPQRGGLWGSTAAPSSGQSIFSQSAPNAPATSQQQSFSRTTKFNDLPDHMQKMFESIDSYVQGRIQISHDLKARSLGDEPTKGSELIRKVHNVLVNTMSTLQADKAFVAELKSKVDQSVQDTIITTRIIDGFKHPQQNGAHLKNHSNFPLEFFTRAAEEIRQKLQWYKSTVEQIERRLASAQSQVQYNPQAITATLQAQNATFIGLAGKTADLDADLQAIKLTYRELWRAHTGSARDPFDEVDRRSGDGDKVLNGIASLDLRKRGLT